MQDPKSLLFANWRECARGCLPEVTRADLATALAYYEAAMAPLAALLPEAAGPAERQRWQMAATNALLRLLHASMEHRQN